MADEPAVQFLRGVLTRLRSQPWERDHLDPSRDRAAGEDARTRIATMLSPDHIGGTDPEALLGLLRDAIKQHRSGNGLGILKEADPARLREALALLADERRPLAERLDRLRPPGGGALVKGLGPSAISSVLHRVDPDRYGLLSGTSEGVLRRLGVYPELPRSASFAVRYEAVNGVLLRLAAALGIDLGLLDHLFWRVQPHALSDFAPPQAHARRGR